MKHPSQRSGPLGGPPARAAGDDLPAAQPAGDAAPARLRAEHPAEHLPGLPAGHPSDLLAVDLEALRAEIEALASAGQADDVDERAEAVRERYSELLEDYEDDAEALTRIRAVGRRIKDLEEADVLPRSLILRGRSRR